MISRGFVFFDLLTHTWVCRRRPPATLATLFDLVLVSFLRVLAAVLIILLVVHR